MWNDTDLTAPDRRALALLPAILLGASVVFAPSLALAAGGAAAAPADRVAAVTAPAHGALADAIAEQGRAALAAMQATLSDPDHWAGAACDGLAQALAMPARTNSLARAAVDRNF